MKHRKHTFKVGAIQFRNASIIIPIFLLLFLTGCVKENDEAPFFDGFYLKYTEVFGASKKTENNFWTREITYKFTKDNDGNFQISENVQTQRGQRLDKDISPTPYPKVNGNILLNKNGIVIGGGDSRYFINGQPSYLWLPPEKRDRGAKLMDGLAEVRDITQWKKWEVLRVDGLLGDITYYDVNTGILIGNEQLNGKVTMVLEDSNLSALKSRLSGDV